jgi:hypothetical protein
MNISTQTIKIQHEKFGVLLNETFVNPTQFKLFLKMVNGCLNCNEALTFFNGEDFLVNIPNQTLKDCIVTTSVDFQPSTPYTLSDHIINKTKIEQPA